jgi:hypothetical protein
MMTKIGQKIAPGPMPQNAAAKAPKNEILIIITKFFVSDLKSPSTNVYPFAILSLYSALLIIIPIKVKKPQIT